TTVIEVVHQTYQELFTFYVPASETIKLDFKGSEDRENAVYIRSNSDITLAGNVIVANEKTVHLEANAVSGASGIRMVSGTGIMARMLDGSFPGSDVAQLNVHAFAYGGAIDLNIMGSQGYTRAEARNDINLTYFSQGDSGA